MGAKHGIYVVSIKYYELVLILIGSNKLRLVEKENEEIDFFMRSDFSYSVIAIFREID